jgi:hypothetical protein
LLPYLLTNAFHPANAPGTVTERAPVPGTCVSPAATKPATSTFDPDRPEASRPINRPSRADQTMANMSPPIPVMCGSVTLSTAAAATAASTALPPASRIASAAAVASGWLVATAARGA